MPAVYGYWNLKGIGEMGRLMLEYTGEEYQDDVFDEFNGYHVWDQAKSENPHKLPFPNLPYYVDGDVRLTQSVAIVRYLARKHGLAGNSEAETQKLDVLEGQALDMRMWNYIMVYSGESNFQMMKDKFLPRAATFFKQFAEYLGANKWFLGDRLTYVDFMLYDMFMNFDLYDSSLLQSADSLRAFVARFEALPALRRYMKSDKFTKWPFNGPTGCFANETRNG